MALDSVRRLKLLKDILEDLKLALSKDYDKTIGFAIAFVFNNLFEECWKLMQDILMEYYGYHKGTGDIGGPRNTINTAYECNLIHSDRWIKMMLDRNNTTHDYRNQNIDFYTEQIRTEYIYLIENFIDDAEKILTEENKDEEKDDEK